MPFTPPTNADGSLATYSDSDIATFGILTTNVRDGSHPTYTREYGQSTIRATYFCLPDYFDEFCYYMLGGAALYTAEDDGNTHLSRVMPQTYPDYPEFACTKLERAVGHGPDGEDDDPDGLELPVPVYNRIKCSFLFEHVPFELATDEAVAFDETQRYLQVLPSNMDVEYIPYQGGIVRYLRSDGQTGKPNQQTIQSNIGFPEIHGTVARKWVRVPYAAWTAGNPDSGTPSPLWSRVYGAAESGIAPFAGTINQSALFGYPAGTLLFTGVDEELKRDPLGQGFAWDLTFKWLFKPRLHNWFYYNDPPADTPGFSDASGYYFAGRGTTAYSTATLPDGVALFNAREHNLLFQLY